jgi:hypothetical protein
VQEWCQPAPHQHKSQTFGHGNKSFVLGPHSDEYAEAPVALHYKPAGEYIVLDSILDTFVYSLLEFYAAKLAVDDSKENTSPNFDFEQKMAPSISLTVVEKKLAPCVQIPSLVSAWAPFAQ